MKNRLERILKDIYDKTGTSVRLAPHGDEEMRFEVNFDGERVPLWIAGNEESSGQASALVGYLIENADPLRLSRRGEEDLRNLLLGGGKDSVFRFMTKFDIQDAPCFALDVVPEKRVNEAAALIERCLEDTQDVCAIMDSSRIAVVRFVDGDQTPHEFGQFLCTALYEELGVRAGIGIGCQVQSFSEIATSYSQAAVATRMSAAFRSKDEVHTYREFLLVKMLEDLPKHKLAEYMAQYGADQASEIFEDEEMASTAEGFLENSLNVSEASRSLYMHRNTLMYRLDKIERITGLNIRLFSDAVTYRVISILYKLLQS